MNSAKPAAISTKHPDKLWKWLTGVLVICILVRVILFLIYPPVSFSDTGSYRRLAEAVLNGWVNYDGTRTPGYPVFLALIGPDRAVVVTQMVMGILITLIIFTGMLIRGDNMRRI